MPIHIIVPWSRPDFGQNVQRNVDAVRCGVPGEPTTVTIVRVGHAAPIGLPTLDIDMANAASARNAALRNLKSQGLTGPVAFLDDDDEFSEAFLRRCLAALELHPKCAWVSGWTHLVLEAETDRVFLLDPHLSDCLAMSAMGGCLMHRELQACPLFDASLDVGEDTAWGTVAGPGWRLPAGAFLHLMHAGQTSRMPSQVRVHAASVIYYLVGGRKGLTDAVFDNPMSHRLKMRFTPDPQVVFDWMRSRAECQTPSSAST